MLFDGLSSIVSIYDATLLYGIENTDAFSPFVFIPGHECLDGIAKVYSYKFEGIFERKTSVKQSSPSI